ncbi:F-box/LRR-repeat protein 16 [Sergentomyia squamirostris]
MIKMSSISAQGVVERASAELSKRINGLGLRKHHGGATGHAKASVMERVTNVLCGGSSHASANSLGAPEKPSRMAAMKLTVGKGAPGPPSHGGTPQPLRKSPPAPPILTVEQLLMDERFLSRFFLYFSPLERCVLAQVCQRWRDVLYRSPRYWSGLLPVLQSRELRQASGQDRVKLYNSLIRRGFHAICLLGATDEDALDIVHSFPLASKHIHSLGLRCSSVSDRGLEALLDHLQYGLDLRSLRPA